MSQIKIDVRFGLIGDSVPINHGYPLFGAICSVLGDLHGAEWLAVHPLIGIVYPDNMLAFTKQCNGLTLRIAPDKIQCVLPLAGKILKIKDSSISVGIPNCYILKPSKKLVSRTVVIKGFTEPEDFKLAVGRQLNKLEISGNVEVARRRVVNVGGKKIIGFKTIISELSDEHSLLLQTHGMGGKRRMGCGVFVGTRDRL